jgi:DNA repair protein RadA/Sms
MAKIKKYFKCKECGHKSSRWLGNCPSCHKWNTFEEVTEEPVSNKPVTHKARLSGSKPVEPVKLSQIKYNKDERICTGIGELDRVLGGGFMPASFVLLGGDPGIGKSTLTLHIAQQNPELSILYCSGEESESQIKQRSDRLGLKSEKLHVYTETNLDNIIKQARKLQPDLLVIDSIQTVYRPELQSMPGNITQVKECASMLIQLAKKEHITTLAIGHVTKEGDLAGPRVLEHMVDTVLQFEGDNNYSYRLLRSVKNRFGSVNEIGVFEMDGKGLREITNPSQIFISDYDSSISGNTVICAMEGTRPLLLEVQALVANSSYGVPQRTTTAFDQRRLSLLLAVLEKRCGFHFSSQDVFLNIAGGIKLTETACDIGLITAIISSLIDKPILKNIAFVGEVGLGAEVRAISKIDQRVREVQKMGFESIIIPKANKYKSKTPKLNIIEVSNISEVLNKFF